MKLHQPWRIALWLSQDKNNDKLQLVFLKTMRVFGLERFVVLLLSATHFRESSHARLMRGCFPFSQCFQAGVFSSLSLPPSRSLWLAPFPPLFGFNMALSRAKTFARPNKRLHCRLKLPRKYEIEHWFACGADELAVYGHLITRFSGMGRFT